MLKAVHEVIVGNRVVRSHGKRPPFARHSASTERRTSAGMAKSSAFIIRTFSKLEAPSSGAMGSRQRQSTAIPPMLHPTPLKNALVITSLVLTHGTVPSAAAAALARATALLETRRHATRAWLPSPKSMP